MKSVDLSAGTVEYREEGNPTGPPVVLLHGLLMNDTQWSSTLPLLPTGFRYLLPILPMGGHRIPMREDADLTMDGMLDILADFLDALDLADVTLVISDWGGPLLLTDTGRDKRIARLVICPAEAFDNFPPAPAAKVLWLATRTTGTVAFALRQMRISWLRRLPMMFGQMSRKPIPQDVFEGWTNAALADPRIRRDLIRYCRSRFDKPELIRATNALADFTGPAMVLWSDNNVMPTAHGQRLADLLPNGQLRHIEDARVLVMLDQPERTAAEIGRFLTQ